MGSDKLLHTIYSLESYLYYMSRLMKHNRKIYNLAWKCSVYMYLLISKNIPSILIIDTAIIWAYPDSSLESVSTIYIYIPLAYEYLRESLSARAFRHISLIQYPGITIHDDIINQYEHLTFITSLLFTAITNKLH